MTEFLIYDLKVAALVAVFYMFYRLMLSRETFHRVNRVVLLATALLSFVLPLCVITLHRTVVVEAPLSQGLATVGLPMAEPLENPLGTVWGALFLIGMALTLGHTLLSILRVWQLIRRSEQHPQADGTVVCVAPGDVPAFSWMHFIILSKNDYEAHSAPLLAHERGHIRRRHSLDLLLVDTLTALQWFNPAMWMLRQDLRAIHEYEADAAVLSQGINTKEYQYLLIQKAVANCGYSVANGISHSTLKNRIDMMLHKKSSRASLFKLLALVPIVGAALALQAETVTDYVYNTPKKKTVVKKGKADAELNYGDQTYVVKAIVVDEPTAEVATSGGQDDGKAPYEPKAGERPLIIVNGNLVDFDALTFIHSEEIENIEVFKDAASVKKYSQMYGRDASDGVIIITTKATTDQDEKVFDVVEKMPEYPGGQVALMEFLAKTIRYPEAAHKAGVQGRCIVSFVVETNGAVSNVKVVKSVSPEIDAEAERVVGSMPNWLPGRQNGKPVRVKYTVPLSFRLSEPEKKDVPTATGQFSPTATGQFTPEQ